MLNFRPSSNHRQLSIINCRCGFVFQLRYLYIFVLQVNEHFFVRTSSFPKKINLVEPRRLWVKQTDNSPSLAQDLIRVISVVLLLLLRDAITVSN